MKNIMLAAVVLAISIPTLVVAQDGAMGENFSLEGALDLFQKANSPEDFEKRINEEESNVNNLDLNEDGTIDFITVSDQMEGDVHALVLSVHVSKDEVQDVAVIEIEKNGSNSAILQIVGNEDVFGEQVIVEPFDEVVSSDGRGPSADIKVEFAVVNVWLWPSVRFVYAPVYRPWVSPWRYRVYPRWFKSWRPHSIAVFKVRRHNPYGYKMVKTHRVVKAHKVYTPRKRSSTIVRSKKKVTINKSKNSKVKVAKKTKIKKSNNGKTKVKKTKVKRKNR